LFKTLPEAITMCDHLAMKFMKSLEPPPHCCNEIPSAGPSYVGRDKNLTLQDCESTIVPFLVNCYSTCNDQCARRLSWETHPVFGTPHLMMLQTQCLQNTNRHFLVPLYVVRNTIRN